VRRAALPGPVIIGGGPAGAGAAIVLAQAGRPVTLLERNAAASDKVCGDFLSAEAISALTALGVDLSLAPPIQAVRLIHGNRIATSPLPFRAAGLTRRTLDETLLRQAQASGATVLRGHRVSAIEHCGSALRLTCGSLGPIIAEPGFLATGKHELRGATRTDRGSGRVGLKMYYALDPTQLEALRGNVELILFRAGYAGLQLVEGGQAVFCALVSADRLRAVGGRWTDLLEALIDTCPHLRDRLAGARPLLERPLAIAGLPYGYVHQPSARDLPGLFRLGDQAVVIGSLTGDGVALALASAELAARTWLDGKSATVYHQRLAAGVARQMRLASAIHRLCLSAPTQRWLPAVCRLWPGAIRSAAALTRSQVLTGLATPI
jgi:flavin-dependent dehydrogenase